MSEKEEHLLTVNEIFYSIQGEGSRAGKPCIFIRLTGCDLRCSYCDTDYAFDEGTAKSLTDILTEIKQYPCQLVEITGGEPLLQDSVYSLMTKLCDKSYDVMLETGGQVNVSRVDRRVHKIIDIKTPNSGMAEHNDLQNIELALSEAKKGQCKTEFKIVLCSREDYEWAKAFIEKYRLTSQLPVFFSPASPKLSPQKLAEWILKDGLDVKLQIQLHKALWPNAHRGV